jgi:FkbM family methyltransferase
VAVADLKLRLTTEARTLARQFGLIGPLGSFKRRIDRALGRVDYESRFHDALTSAIRRGDVVWDVGANVGLYTKTFSELVGDSGTVCAFEPVPTCFAELEKRTAELSNARRFAMALGNVSTTASMFTSDDPLGVTHSLVSDAQKGGGTAVSVPVRTGDELIAEGMAPSPTVLKIDVEGFEEEVLLGLSRTLSRPECRAVFVEVHFAILEGRGARHAPVRIKNLLAERGFHVRWTDASHLAANRTS